MIETINKYWSWTETVAKEIIMINDFGYIIFQSKDGKYWKISPEKLECKVVANNENEFLKLKGNQEFLDLWKMDSHVNAAKKALGTLNKEEKYCLKLPVIFGGLYDDSNFGRISQEEQISLCGQLAFQIKDLPDGEKFNFELF